MSRAPGAHSEQHQPPATGALSPATCRAPMTEWPQLPHSHPSAPPQLCPAPQAQPRPPPAWGEGTGVVGPGLSQCHTASLGLVLISHCQSYFPARTVKHNPSKPPSQPPWPRGSSTETTTKRRASPFPFLLDAVCSPSRARPALCSSCRCVTLPHVQPQKCQPDKMRIRVLRSP